MNPLLAWAPLAASALHIVEEFFLPGGFAEWDRAYRPEIAASITKRFHIGINALLLGVGLMVGVAGFTPSGTAAWLTLAALLFSNAIYHVVGALKTRRYSPGLVTGLLLYVPLAIYGYVVLVGGGQASPVTALAAALLGGSYPLLSMWMHARRARRAPRR